MKLILILLLAASRLTAGNPCVVISGEWVTAAELATRLPQLERLAPDTRLMTAPSIGVRRLLAPSDFKNSIGPVGFPGNLCIERAGRPLEIDEVREALAGAASLGQAQFEVVDFDRRPLPPGRLEFDRSTLPQSSSTTDLRAVLWPGRRITSTGQAISVWARVLLWRDSVVCVLDHELHSGSSISLEDCHPEQRRNPIGSSPISEAAQLAGRIAARHLAKGTALYESMLTTKPSVVSGQKASVAVIRGPARVVFEARVSGSARIGETVMVTNPGNGHHLNARVVGEGLLEVHLQ